MVLGYVSLTVAEEWLLISKYHSNLASDEIKVDQNPNRNFLERSELLVQRRYFGTVMMRLFQMLVFVSDDFGRGQSKMRVTYHNPHSRTNPEQLKSVNLEFYKQEDGTWHVWFLNKNQ